MVMVFVPAGEFTMGSDNGDGDEKPVHKVILDSYWIDQTEVTNATYKQCVDSTSDKKCNLPSDTSHFGNSDYANHPVVYVSWNDANTYCSWAGRRLPTAAEWEKAARGDDLRTYPWGDSLDCSFANYWGKKNGCVGDTTKVKTYPTDVSPYGAYDMGGNAWEWVADWYNATYYQSSPSFNPLGPDSGQYRELRGGSWSHSYYAVHSANRDGNYPSHSNDSIGFRCSR